MGVQETRLKPACLPAAARWTAHRGLRMHASGALATGGEGPNATSAGVATLAGSHIGATAVDLTPFFEDAVGRARQVEGATVQWLSDRLVATHYSCAIRHGILVLAAYFVDSVGLTGLNILLVEVLAVAVRSLGYPWVIAAD